MQKTINTVCVVDDDLIYQFTTKKIIESTKLVEKIITFSDGEKAIEFFYALSENAVDTPDIVLLDINMPIMDGWDFLKEYVMIKPKLSKKITIYLVSSSVHDTDVERAKQMSDVTDYVIKPVTRDKFIEMFRDFLNV
jgi:CheY-like chemotaxis protein